MASSVAKLKPLPSMIAEPDDVFVQTMEENEVLAGLARSGDTTRKAAILDELRANTRRNGGRFQFEDRLALFRVLRGVLCDTNASTRQRCIEFLSEIIPEFGEDLDKCMSLILPQLVSNLGDGQTSVKKSAIQTLHMYMKHSSQVSAVLNGIIEHGLESDDRRTRTESLVALPILIMPNLAHQDLFTLTKALVVRLEISARPETSPAIISLERIKNVVGPASFESYLRLLSPDQQNLCLLALENRDAETEKEIELLGSRKAKSAGHLNSNGVVLEARDGILDRGHTIAGSRINAADDFFDNPNYGSVEFGFLPGSVMAKLRDHSNWRIRAQGIEELKTVTGLLHDTAVVIPHLGSLFGMLLDFLDDVNFKIGITSLQIIGLLVAKLGVSVQPCLNNLLTSLSSKLGDNKIVIRQENMKVLMQLMQIVSPKEVLAVMTSGLQHRNSRVREETVNVVTAALLTFPSSDFDLPALTNAIAPALVDSKRRVRQAALEAFAVIAQAMGPGRFQPVISAVDAIELTMGGDGVMAAITARLARRQLPRLNRDGLVEYAVPMPSSGTIRGQSSAPRGSDIDWILAGTTGTGSADPSGSAHATGLHSAGLNDSLNMSGPSPRRFFSAGKNRLPWEADQGREASQLSSDAVEPMPPAMKLNSWGPAEIINDRAVKSTPQARVSTLATPTKSKATSSYAEKYLAKSVQRANQVADHQHTPKVADGASPAGPSYAEMHRAKAKKDKGKISNKTVPGIGGSTVNSYALLYKRGTISTKGKASSSAEPSVGEQPPKETAPRGSQSATPTPFSLQSSFSPGDKELSPPSQRRAVPLSMSLSSSWPDWTEMKSQGRPWGRLSPVSHTIPTDMDTSADSLDSEPRKSEVPQTPIHLKPQLVRSASKSRGLRAPEFGEIRKGDSQPTGIDYLELSPTRPTQLAPVNAGNNPPPDLLRQVHKQAETKRALKMYAVTNTSSDSDDGEMRSPSPLETSDPLTGLPENSPRPNKIAAIPDSPFDSKPRIARTPLSHSRRLSAGTPLQLQSPTPLPSKLSDSEVTGLGVMGYGLLAPRSVNAAAMPPLENGFHNGDDVLSKTSGVGSSRTSGHEEDVLGVEVIGRGLSRSDLQGASQDTEGGNQLEYETEESDEGIEDDDGDGEEEEDEEEEEEVEEEEEEEQEESESGSGEASEGDELTQPSQSEAQPLESQADKTTASTSLEKTAFKGIGSSESSEDSIGDSDPELRAAAENQRDMTPRTMRKSLSKSTRERMERRRLEKEERLQREQQKMEEFDRERAKQRQIQQEEEERLRQKIMKEQQELVKMFDRKEKEREAEKNKQRLLQEELKNQEKALRDRLQKQQEELEAIEQEKQREREKQKERMKEKMRLKQKQKQQEMEQKEREQEEEIKRKLAEKEVELEREKAAQRSREAAAAAAEEESKDLSVTGSSTALKPSVNKKPPVGSSPKKKPTVSSAQSDRDAGYAVTDDPTDLRRHFAASAGSTSSQCWEVSLEDLQPFNNPANALKDALKYLANTEDWEMKCEGIQGIRRLAKHHPETIVSQIQTVIRAILAEVKNLRSQVSRSAICCLGDMFTCLGKHMDSELEAAAKILLSKASESSGFIRGDVEKSLATMVNSLNPTRVLVALVSGGASHRNVAVRKTTAQFLSLLTERMGPSRVLSGAKDVTEKMLPTAAQFLTDNGQDTRYYGRKIILIVCEHPEFEKYVAKYVPANLQKTVRDTVENLRIKGLGEPPSDLSSSARQRKPASGSSGSRSLRGSLVGSPASASSRESTRSGKSMAREGLVQGEEVILNLINSLQANDWKERQQAVDQFADLVQLNPDGLGPKFTKVFDAFIPRLQDSNSKVNLHALHCLPKILPGVAHQTGSLIPPLVSAVTSNLASKNPNIFSKAEEAFDGLIKWIDNSLLVQPFCTAAQYGSSRVRPIMIDKLADIVPTVCARKPQAISRHVLPVLWNLLGSTSNGSAGANNGAIKHSVSKLTNTLHSCMGKALLEQASGQAPRVQEKLHEIIGS